MLEGLENSFMSKIQNLREKDFSVFIKTPIAKIGDKKRTICQFHFEKTPSLFIYKNNSYHCFGCGAHGNAIDFVMNKFSYTFKQACDILEGI